MNKLEKENLDGFKFILPNFRIYSHGINVYCLSSDIPIFILWEGRRARKIEKLSFIFSYLSVHNHK